MEKKERRGEVGEGEREREQIHIYYVLFKLDFCYYDLP